MTYLMMAIVVSMMGALLWAPGLRRLALGDPPKGLGRHLHALNCFTLIAMGVWCYIAIRAGARMDYEAYLIQWDMVLAGEQMPWGPHSTNAYGPLYNLIAPLTLVDPFFPKLLFVFAWIWASAFMIGQALRLSHPIRTAWAIAALMLVSPFCALQIAHYGHFDILPAGLCLLAVHLRRKDRDGWAGAALGAAVLLKFYPLAMLPFLMLDGRRLRLRVGVWCVGLIALGMLASYLAWGESTWHPLMFAAERPSRWMSIFRFLRGPYSPLGLFMDDPNVDFLSGPSVVVFGGAVWLACWWRRVDVVSASIAGLATGLHFYKVGHAQFLMVLVVLIGYWMAIGEGSPTRRRAAFWAALVSVLWWTAFMIVWVIMRRFARPSIPPYHDPASLIALAQTAWLVLAMIGQGAKPQDRGSADTARPDERLSYQAQTP